MVQEAEIIAAKGAVKDAEEGLTLLQETSQPGEEKPAGEQPSGTGQKPAGEQPSGTGQKPAGEQPSGIGQKPTDKVASPEVQTTTGKTQTVDGKVNTGDNSTDVAIFAIAGMAAAAGAIALASRKREENCESE